MKYVLVLMFLVFSTFLVQPAVSAPLVEYHMQLPQGEEGAKRVALTFDACMGKVDTRIVDALVHNKIKATIFVSARWLKYNKKSIEILKANSDLFEIENHGAQHVTALDERRNVYGLKSAGSADAVSAEVEDGAASVLTNFGYWPKWYRGAGAIYTNSSMELIKDLDFKLAGFSISGDGGALWTAAHSAKVVAGAKDGDVIIAHINQPAKPAGTGVVAGILKLKAEGFAFVRLDEAFY